MTRYDKILHTLDQFLDKILHEKTYDVVPKSPMGKKLLVKGISIIMLDEGQPPDVHGIPKGLDAYGRGGFDRSNKIWIDGGPQGSSSGHPPFIRDGFYWGVDFKKNILYIRGRAGVDTLTLEKNLGEIIESIFPRIR